MRPFVRSTLTAFAALLVMFFAIGAVGYSDPSIDFFLMFFGFPTLVLTFIGLSALFIGRGVLIAWSVERRRDRIVIALFAPLLALMVGVIAIPMFQAGGYVGALGVLLVNLDRYESAVALAREGRPISQQYTVDNGPPVRVAFYQHGFLDNWTGIVFDPTGDVMLAKGFDSAGTFAAPDRVTKLFGGDLVRCRHLLWDYYRCSFT